MYNLSARSRSRLVGVHPKLVAVVVRAIQVTKIDFTVLEGLRSKERQAQLVKSGASQTMNSRHLTGHAVDLAPYLDTDGDGDKEVSWHWPHYFILAEAVRKAAQEQGCPIRWGGCWDRSLTNSYEDPEHLANGYVARRRALGKKAFIDGPHFELPRDLFP